ncbi:MAG: hypothetical protein Q7S09_05710 [bacterium]|nr:hypothetical protein [bacterium]
MGKIFRKFAEALSMFFLGMLPVAVYAETSFILPPVGSVTPDSPSQLIHVIYLYGLATVGIAGFAAFFYGGVKYLTAVGNPTKAEDAKDRLVHALLGFLVVVFAGATLRFINPDLFKFIGSGAPGVFEGVVRPIDFLPGGGYLSCKIQGDAGTFCAPTEEGTCGDDSQCAPCIGRVEGDACVQAKTAEGDFEYLSCVSDIPCNTASGGTCPANYPCSEVTGGFRSEWEVAPDSKCQDPERPVECIDGADFVSATHVCCSKNSLGTSASAPSQENLEVSCFATPNPSSANMEDGVHFGIHANGMGSYDCRWSGTFEAIGCNPEYVFPLPGNYTQRVEVTDLTTFQKVTATCTANVGQFPFTITNLRTGTDALPVRFCPDDPWELRIDSASKDEDVFVKIWKDGFLLQDWVSLGGATLDGTPLGSYTGVLQTKTDSTGSWSLSGQFKPDLIADWQIQTRVRGVEGDIISFQVKPCMILKAGGAEQRTILPNPDLTPICVEEPWTLEVLGPAGADVWIQQTFNGSVWSDWTNFSPPQTDPTTGHWFTSGNFDRCLVGDWSEQARLQDAAGIERFSDELTFSVKSCLDSSPCP